MKYICTVMHYRLEVCLHTLAIGGALRASEAIYLGKFGILSTREILVSRFRLLTSAKLAVRAVVCLNEQ